MSSSRAARRSYFVAAQRWAAKNEARRQEYEAMCRNIINCYKVGMSLRAVGELHSLSHERIRQILKDRCVQLRGRGRR